MQQSCKLSYEGSNPFAGSMGLKTKKKSTKKKKTRVVDFLLTPKKIGLTVQQKSDAPRHEIGVTGNPLDGEFGMEYKVKF